MNPILETPFDFILQGLAAYVFGNMALVGLFVIIMAIIFCMANEFDLTFTFIVITPLLIGLVGATYLPNIIWAFPIGLSIVLWTLVFFKIGGIQT